MSAISASLQTSVLVLVILILEMKPSGMSVKLVWQQEWQLALHHSSPLTELELAVLAVLAVIAVAAVAAVDYYS